jgi:hypothetical protein
MPSSLGNLSSHSLGFNQVRNQNIHVDDHDSVVSFMFREECFPKEKGLKQKQPKQVDLPFSLR